MFFKIKTNDIVSEQLEEEVVVINMSTGTYYSLKDSGADLWQQLLSGGEKPKLCKLLEDRYEGDSSVFEAAVDIFLKKLTAEGLLDILAEPQPEAETSKPERTSASHKEQFIAPEIEIYTDVQDLLLLDPVHQVTDEGWPKNPASSEKS